ESSPEERIEIERLCKEDPQWESARDDLRSTLGLLEDACSQTIPAIEEGMELDADRKTRLEFSRAGDGETETAEATDPSERSPLATPTFWGPLAAAACAALLVWGPGLMEESEPEQIASATNDKEKSRKRSEENEEQKIMVAKAKKQSAAAQSDGTFAIELPEDAQAIGETVVIDALREEADKAGAELLAGRTAADIETLNQSVRESEPFSLADAFSDGDSAKTDDLALAVRALASGAPATIDSSAFLPPLEPEAGAAPSPTGIGLESVDGELALLGRKAALSTFRAKESSHPTDPERPRAKKDNLLSLQPSARPTLEKTLEKRDRPREKPASWTQSVRKPASCFLFSQNGQALGRVEVAQIDGSTIEVRRIDDVRRGKRFLLTPGKFQLRFTDPDDAVVILAGELRKRQIEQTEAKKEEEAFDGTYRFEASEAWWLDRNEIRQALPIKELGR
ncbi:MAG TPA: hypothetical protein DCG39_12120, partial [Opitutae bacterium]|nr:hypothetical protein [Opitutae bacterium]